MKHKQILIAIGTGILSFVLVNQYLPEDVQSQRMEMDKYTTVQYNFDQHTWRQIERIYRQCSRSTSLQAFQKALKACQQAVEIARKFGERNRLNECIRNRSTMIFQRLDPLFQQFLTQLLLCPNQPFVPSKVQDQQLHKLWKFGKFSPELRPFQNGFILHRPSNNVYQTQTNFMQTIALFKTSNPKLAQQMLTDGAGACDVLYYPNSCYWQLIRHPASVVTCSFPSSK